ncbi:MAG: hypothetical protein MZW92_51545 [Comamonadaceae bacterium]|nr:hypothetical protein [Comamonadaceae bacterium]
MHGEIRRCSLPSFSTSSDGRASVFEAGTVTDTFSAICALRMRVSGYRIGHHLFKAPMAIAVRLAQLICFLADRQSLIANC